MKLFCGIDWAEAHHDVAIIDGDGHLVAKKRITDDPDGFAETHEHHRASHRHRSGRGRGNRTGRPDVAAAHHP